MLKISVIAAGRLNKGPFHEICQDFLKRMSWPVEMVEVESKHKVPVKAQEEEAQKILERIDPQSFTIVLDGRGDGLRSLDFANTLENLKNTGGNKIQFVIGGADGLTDDVRDKADVLLSFGQQTWPHMLARVMLLEQIYRAQQILSGHPYHRE